MIRLRGVLVQAVTGVSAVMVVIKMRARSVSRTDNVTLPGAPCCEAFLMRVTTPLRNALLVVVATWIMT